MASRTCEVRWLTGVMGAVHSDVSHSLTVPSIAPEASIVPSGENDTE